MANNPIANSSNSNLAHELGLGFDRDTDNFYAGANPLINASNLRIMRIGWVGQFQQSQMANELRRTREIMGWIQGQLRIQSGEGDHQVLGAGSSSTTPIPYEVGASSAHGNVRTPAQLLGASSSSSSPSIIGTVTAKELMESQILYKDPSIWKHLRTNPNLNDNGYNPCIQDPSPGLGLDLHNRSWQQETPATVSTPPHQINNMGIVIERNDDDDNDDGRIRSLSHKKNGPYTCSKCNQEFPSSQHFANHVHAKHYKHKSKAQRSKRLMSKLRPRNFCIGKVNGQITCLPISASKAPNIAGNSFAPRFNGGNRPFAIKVEVDKEVGLQDQTSSPNGRYGLCQNQGGALRIMINL